MVSLVRSTPPTALRDRGSGSGDQGAGGGVRAYHRLVYELYGLTDEEIALVEGNARVMIRRDCKCE